MNFNRKGYCDVNHTDSTATVQTKLTNVAWQQNRWHNNKDACQNAGFVWYEFSHADNLNLPANNFVCAKTKFARANQLGNVRGDDVVSQNAPAADGVLTTHVTEGINANRFLWKVPNIPQPKAADPSTYFTPSMTAAYQHCTLRIRYNISGSEFQQWPDDAVDPGTPPMVDYRNNSRSASDPRTPLLEDPYIFMGPGDSQDKGDKFVKLKVNTNQYGRTFQDRSYSFTIKPLPTTNVEASNAADTPEIDATAINAALAAGGKIYNVNVRGKRGNIVQVFMLLHGWSNKLL